MNKILIPFIISFLAGLGTIIGSCISMIPKLRNKSYITLLLTFSGFIMIYISLYDLIPMSLNYLFNNYKLIKIIIIFIICFSLGSLLIFIIDKKVEESSINKISIVSFIAIVLHNIPEGIITFTTSMIDTRVGVKLAISILMHNIPEGIIINIKDKTHSTLNRVGTSIIASLSEPFGALLTYLFFKNYINNLFISYILIFVSGIMITLTINNIFKYLINSNNKLYILYGILISLLYIILI